MENSTHLGTEYAALLVDADYIPPAKVPTLPAIGNGVSAVATVAGRAAGTIPSKTIHFSGYDWMARASGSNRGGEANEYDIDNAWVDDKGYLHLRTDYLTNWRLGVAQTMLRKGNSLKLIASAVGYANATALTRAFTQRVGMSPSEWLVRGRA